MNLRNAAFLADENILSDVVAFLRAEGCDVLSVQESSLIGSDDVTLIRQAFSEQRIILTHDSDFGTLAVAANEPIVGIVYLRPGHIRAEFTVGTLRTLFDQEIELIPPFVLVAKRSGERVNIRIRTL